MSVYIKEKPPVIKMKKFKTESVCLILFYILLQSILFLINSLINQDSEERSYTSV